MESNKSLDEITIIAALLHDFQKSHGGVFTTRALRLTIGKVRKRVRFEGIGFLTKTLPRLGKAFDKALTQEHALNATEIGFDSDRDSKLPRFLGELFKRVLDPTGTVLQDPCAECVWMIRQVCFVYYKYELPYSSEQEQQVLQKFERTEQDLSDGSNSLQILRTALEHSSPTSRRYPNRDPKTTFEIAREAKYLLSNVFAFFDPTDILPRHGPGVVATRQSLSGKFLWTNVSKRITDKYPFDEYFCSSLGHVCDCHRRFSTIGEEDLPARVLLVPKDSRGPRLISCEPVDFQWIQQGLSQAIVRLVERHPLTRFNVHFTDQQPNGFGALLGSETGKYATLDLNEASDRVSVELVRLLFPPHIYEYLEACRSLQTVLPSGKVLTLKKFAPMGSALCFPILALTVWAILTAGASDADTREGILVYGDDVIVPTAQAAKAMEQLESFGLKVNRDKSCIKGFFRESCGVDAFKGRNVTPVRIRTVWSSTPSPGSYSSWVAYANSFYDRKCFNVYNYIVEKLIAVYGSIPGEELHLAAPSLRETPVQQRPLKSRTNYFLQKKQYRVWDVKSPSVIQVIDGWSMLLRYFTEAQRAPLPFDRGHQEGSNALNERSPFSVSRYTERRASMLVRRWR